MNTSLSFSPCLSGCEALTEWEYLPPVGPRPTKGFVGLKNAGATCYMNSVIQQLYMIPPIRNGVLAVEGTGTDVDDELSGDEKQENEVTGLTGNQSKLYSLFRLNNCKMTCLKLQSEMLFMAAPPLGIELRD